MRLNLLKLLYRTLLTHSENNIFDDVTITSALCNDILIHGEVFWYFSKVEPLDDARQKLWKYN